MPERDLADLIYSYGEERGSRRIARQIALRRSQGPLRTTKDLADAVVAGIGWRRGRGERQHPATRTFQALRIAVNDELGGLRDGLTAALEVLAPGAPMLVISFHSLEDRIVKRFFHDQAGRCSCPPGIPECRCGASARLRIVTPKPVSPAPAELAANPRSRSAKLRVAEKLGGTERVT
jgi:16S rRNA (cytosine1402-N4)-methyltransferase